MKVYKCFIFYVLLLFSPYFTNCSPRKDAKSLEVNKDKVSDSELSDVNNSNEVKTKDYCDMSDDEVNDALSSLFMIGNGNIEVAYNDYLVFKRCFEIMDSAQLVLDYLKCVPPGSLTLLYSTLANSFIHSDTKRCLSSDWRRHYMDFSRCLKYTGEESGIHQCSYKMYDVFKITENMSTADQLPFICCSMKLYDSCIYNSLYNECDKHNADFGYYYFWFHTQAMFDKGCPGYHSTKHCRKVYPNYMRRAENIFKSESILSPKNYFDLLFDVLLKRGRRLPHWKQAFKQDQG